MFVCFLVVRFISSWIKWDQCQYCNEGQEGKGNFWDICYHWVRCFSFCEERFLWFTVLSACGLNEKPSYSGPLTSMSKTNSFGTISLALMHINYLIVIYIITFFSLFSFSICSDWREALWKLTKSPRNFF